MVKLSLSRLKVYTIGMTKMPIALANILLLHPLVLNPYNVYSQVYVY
jgi:hypothetical protein